MTRTVTPRPAMSAREVERVKKDLKSIADVLGVLETNGMSPTRRLWILTADLRDLRRRLTRLLASLQRSERR